MSKLKFHVVSCSGEDDHFPVTELNTHTPHTQGYRTKACCDYPQEIGIEILEGSCRLSQIQLLSHQYCIATKVEVFIGQGSSYEKANLTRLGFFQLSENVQSDYRARELKSVYVDKIAAQFVKFRLHANHINKHNLYSQVGLVGINILGEPTLQTESSFSLPGQSNPIQYSSLEQRPSVKTTPMDDLSFDMHFDEETAEKIRRVHAAKTKATEIEDYDQAKQLKAVEESLKHVGLQIARLQAQKKEAVVKEDFDEAKRIKFEVDKLKRTLDEKINACPLLRHNQTSHHHAPSPPRMQNEAPPASPQKTNTISHSDHNGHQQQHTMPTAPQMDPVYDEDRPLDTGRKERNDSEQRGMISSSPAPSEYADDNDYNSDKMNPNFEGIPGAELLKDPPHLPQGVESEANLLSAIIGEYFTRCFYSKLWQHRDAAIIKATIHMNQYSNDPKSVFLQCVKMIEAGLSDRIATVFQSSIKLLDALLSKYKHMSKDEACPMLSKIVSLLNSKLGDGQSRIHNSTLDILFKMSKTACVGSAFIITPLLRVPKKRGAQWKPIWGRIVLLGNLLDCHGLDGDIGFSAKSIMGFLNDSEAISHSIATVRESAKDLTVKLYAQIGSDVDGYLGALRPRQLDEYRAAFEAADNGQGTGHPSNQSPKKPKQSSSSRTAPPPPARTLPVTTTLRQEEEEESEEEEMEEFTCQFCKKFDPSFTPENLDVHYWSQCELLTPCSYCDQVVEIECLNEHLISECEYKAQISECKRCGEAINADRFLKHQERNDCPMLLSLREANRCPLCHTDIAPEFKGWREHLLMNKCPNNLRSQ